MNEGKVSLNAAIQCILCHCLIVTVKCYSFYFPFFFAAASFFCRFSSSDRTGGGASRAS